MATFQAEQAETLEILRRIEGRYRQRSPGRALARNIGVAVIAIVAMVLGLVYGLSL